MKIVIFRNCFLLMMLLSCLPVVPQQVWQAQHHSERIILEGELPLQQGDSILLSLPEQGTAGVALKATASAQSLENESYGLSLKIEELSEEKLTGTFCQYDDSFPVTFSKVKAVQPLSFPQHPKMPLPYETREISFKGKKTKITYDGTLSLPENIKEYPLAILITGTGQQDRNYTYSGHQFFTVLADYLARHGIASIRLDDRGIGKTGGNFAQATTADFAADVEEAINFLQKDKKLDTSFLGLIGHSEGGMIASIVASRPHDLKFMVSLSGVGIEGREILKLQNRKLLKSSEMPQELVDKNMELYSVLFESVYQSTPKNLDSNLEATMQNWVSTQDSLSLQQMGLTDGGDQNFIYRYQRQANSPWYRYMIKYEPEYYLPKIQIPVLVVNGGEDNMVPAEENIAGFQKYIRQDLLTTKIFPGLNHMYQHCQSCIGQEVARIDEVFAPEVLNFTTHWINSNFRDLK